MDRRRSERDSKSADIFFLAVRKKIPSRRRRDRRSGTRRNAVAVKVVLSRLARTGLFRTRSFPGQAEVATAEIFRLTALAKKKTFNEGRFFERRTKNAL